MTNFPAFVFNTFAEFFVSIFAALFTLLVVLTGGCSDAARAQQMIDVANQSGANYNVTVSGQPGLVFDLGNRFALTTGTTVSANLSGTFRAPAGTSVPTEFVTRWEAVADDLKIVLERLAALERANTTTPVNPNP